MVGHLFALVMCGSLLCSDLRKFREHNALFNVLLY